MKRQTLSNHLPSGNTHLQICLTGAAIIGGGLYYAGYPVDALTVAGAMIFGETMLSNDLDGYASNAKRRWRRVGLSWIWATWERWPHRHPCTHFPILADALRVLYLASIALAGYFAVRLLLAGFQRAVLDSFAMVSYAGNLVIANQRMVSAAFVGLSIATAIHSTADWITGEADKVVDYVVGKPKRKQPARRAPQRKAA